MRRARVLVVDDSAFARKVLREVLSAEPAFDVVGFARDGADALEKIAELEPDVITLDLVMPGLSGVDVLEALQKRSNAPHAVVVTTADEQSEMGVAALAAGAFDVVHKPSAIATDRLYEVGDDLVATVRAAMNAPRGTRAPKADARAAIPIGSGKPVVDLVVIGTSTGGPQALSLLLGSLSKEFPVPIAIVLHMPIGYTASYADRIDRECALDVFEARDMLELVPGRVVLAQAGVHMKVERVQASLVARLDVMPTNTPHRPAVDVLFSSAALALGPRVLGVVLTGMGSDGLDGSRSLRARGAPVLAEAESSCVVYGMPRVVVEAGLSEAQVPLESMARVLSARVFGAASR